MSSLIRFCSAWGQFGLSRVCGHRAAVLGFLAAAVFVESGEITEASELSDIRFNRDIRPILSENCFACHGPDPGSRKAGLRLDTREGFFAVREKHGAPVVSGQPDKSPLYRRLMATDPEEVMPPPDSHKTLKPGEKELVQQWIAQGAPWQPHWSFLKPERPPVPTTTQPGRVWNPVDAFILKRLETKGLTSAPEADRRTLARRLALDLTGLPPKPTDVEAFVGDTAPDAYEKLVRKYMDSPQWGEHRGRFWLDAARYADTHGLHFDNYREMWPYRDWVIEAFNRNQPFDQFTVEQIAGDLLPTPTQDQLVATGFHRCNITTNEGGTIEEENLAGYARDRVETTSWVWLGLTANCCVCHDHKFDPIPTKDFYAMSAFFRNTMQGGLDGNVKDSKPNIVVIKDGPTRERYEALPGMIERAKTEANAQRTAAEPAFEHWAAESVPDSVAHDLTVGMVLSAPLNEGSGPVTVSIQGVSQVIDLATNVVWSTPEKGKLGPGLLFPGDAKVQVPNVGDFEHDQAFSYGAWVYLPPGFNSEASVFSKMDPADNYRGWDLWHQQGGQFAAHFVSQWPNNALKVRTTQRLAKKDQWQHVFVTYDGSGKPEGVRIYIDGKPVETEVDTARELTGSMTNHVPLTLGQRANGNHFTGGGLQDLRIYSRVLKAGEVRGLARATEWHQALFQPLTMWDKDLRTEIFEYFLQTRSEPYEAAARHLAERERERDGIRLRFPVTHIQQEKTDSAPMARILYRGQYDQAKEEVKPAVFSALNPLPPGAPATRLGLAQWLVSPENPLMARVTVNRYWQELFGTGLVKTSEDFGIMGETPVNQDLLDWLAVEFRESGWDVKRFFTLLVTSATYRQSAQITPESLEKDPANRLLSRGPRFRMDGEMVRDYALAASELLVPKIGGVSVKPYQPEGVWEAVAMPESNTKSYQRERGDGLYRRSLYTFWKRAAPPASMEVFNAPSRETSCLRRERTDTPLQALNTLNDIQFVEAARHLAEVALREGKTDLDRTLDALARRLLARPLLPRESAVVKGSFEKLNTYYTNEPEAAIKLISFGESKVDPSLSAPRLAALTMVANQLLNLDEVLNK